jgi:DNA-binding transcriptional MerR regulator
MAHHTKVPEPSMSTSELPVELPPIPAKRYFTIGEVSELCCVKPHVLRYWEQEFSQLKPLKRRGNRRYYQHHEVLLIRRIRHLLYDEGFTISGARNRLGDAADRAAYDPEAAVRLSAAELQTLRADLTAIRDELAAALGEDAPTGAVDGARDFHLAP